MDINLRFIGKTTSELTIIDSGITLTADVLDVDGFASEQLIEAFRDVAEQLENHNLDLLEKQ